MIRCSKQHEDMLLEYLYRQKEMNLFLIGDIINYGFENKFQTVFMDMEREINAVYLIYHNNLVIASEANKVDKEFVDTLIDEYHIKNINGSKSVIDLLDNLDNWTKQDCYFASLKSIDSNQDIHEVELLDIRDIEKLKTNLQTVFQQSSNTETMLKEIEDQTARHYVIKKNNDIISHAASTAECEGLAMIVGVFTMFGHRKMGYAKKCVSKLCIDLLEEGKTPCLFYNNPDAAKLYKQLGFRDVGDYTLLRKENDE